MSEDRAEQKRRLVEQMKRQLGPDIVASIFHPAVTDIMLNEDGNVFEDRAGKGVSLIARMSPTAAEMFIGTAAAMAGAVVNYDRPVLECALFNGARFAATVAPVTTLPTFAIRCHATFIYTLENYVADGIMTPTQKEAIEQAVADRLNIVVSGGTATGKTTLCNAIAQEVARSSPDHRIVILENTVELQCPNKNKVILQTSLNVDHRKLLATALRYRPDRIVIGEVRGGEALDMLKAWNTGHEGGFCTVHANTARSTLSRLEQLIAEVSAAPQQILIAEAVNLVISIVRDENIGRRVKEMVRIIGYDPINKEYKLKHIGEKCV